MSTWVETMASIAQPNPERARAPLMGMGTAPFAEDGEHVAFAPIEPGTLRRAEKGTVPFFPRPLGTSCHSFEQRLSRARLVYARRREAVFNWIALSVAMFIVLAAPSIDDRCADATPESGMRCLQATEMP